MFEGERGFSPEAAGFDQDEDKEEEDFGREEITEDHFTEEEEAEMAQREQEQAELEQRNAAEAAAERVRPLQEFYQSAEFLGINPATRTFLLEAEAGNDPLRVQLPDGTWGIATIQAAYVDQTKNFRVMVSGTNQEMLVPAEELYQWQKGE